MKALIQKHKLENYVSPPETKEISSSELERLIRSSSGCEKTHIAETYLPSLDVSFLGTGSSSTLSGNIGYLRRGFSIDYTISLPLFAVFNTESSYSQINGKVVFNLSRGGILVYGNVRNIDHTAEFTPSLPEIIDEKLLKGITEKDETTPGNDDNCWIGPSSLGATYSASAYFNGYLPKNIKEKIRVFKRLFGDNQFLISEAEWTEKETKPSPIKDPLLVGVLGKRVYLLDSFNCTTAEEYARREFSSGELNG